MTKKEKQLLAALLKSIQHASVAGVSYEFSYGKLVRIEHVSSQEVDRRLASEDYRLGWMACRETVKMYLDELGINILVKDEANE